MTWWRRAQDRAFNLGLSLAELSRRVHGAIERRDMVRLALALEETMQLDMLRDQVRFAIERGDDAAANAARAKALKIYAFRDALAARQKKLFGKGRAA